jgi:hypothetical protein
VSLLWQKGSVDVRRDVTLVEIGGALPDSLVGGYRQHNSINGLGAVFGTHAKLPAGFQFGLALTTPVTYSFEGTWGDEYHEAIGTNVYHYDFVENRLRYKIKSPWEIGAGLTWATYALTLGADVWYQDWQQATFEGSPYGADSGIDPDTFFETRYNSALRWHVGGELLVPVVNTYVRMGYYRSADPFRGPQLDTGEQITRVEPLNAYTCGAGWLVDRVLSIDVAAVIRSDRIHTAQSVEQRRDLRYLFSLAFRM